MQSWKWNQSLRLVGCLSGMVLASAATAQEVSSTPAGRMVIGKPMATYSVPKGIEIATLYDTGEEVETEWTEVWMPMCGPNRTKPTEADLKKLAEQHDAEFASMDPDDVIIIDSSGEGGVAGAGINIVFSLGSSVPTAAIPAFTKAEAYLESLFSDPITVTVSVTFKTMGSGILGSTSSYYTTTSYTTSRNGLNNNKEAGDVIQSYLPTGSTCPVRYNGNSGTVTNVSTVWWTKAAYKSTIGSVTGNAASMTFNTAFAWDYDPTNGVPSNKMSLVDVVIHEVGHSLGFTSATDWTGNSLTALDLFRFQSTDGSGDYNPDTYAEFQIRPRLVDYNTPNDSHISDIITNEWKMSDGSPYQGSHFREQVPNIGLMDPALAYGETHYPNYFSTADLAMFDAIGYNY